MARTIGAVLATLSRWPRRNKFRAKPQVYDGQKYHSGKEADYARTLDAQRKARDPAQRVKQVKRQVRVSLDVNGCHICDYYVDFVVEYASGRVEWVEVKGFATPEWRLKEKLFRALYPERDYVVVR